MIAARDTVRHLLCAGVAPRPEATTVGVRGIVSNLIEELPLLCFLNLELGINIRCLKRKAPRARVVLSTASSASVSAGFGQGNAPHSLSRQATFAHPLRARAAAT